jgi:hypothetical protein
MEKMPSYTVQTGRNRPACLGLAQPLGLVAQHDGNRGRHSATAALAAVGGSGKPAPEVVVNMCCGRAAVWWTGLRRKRGRRGAHRSCPWRRLRLIGNRRWKHGPGVEGAGDWGGDGSAGSSEGPGRRCTVVPQWQHSGAVGEQRTEEVERVLHGGRAPFIASRGGGRRVARRRNRGRRKAAGSRGRGKSAAVRAPSGL